MAAPTITRTSWVDDDGTGLLGTPVNNAAKQSIYDQIDALAALLYAGLEASNAGLKIRDTDASHFLSVVPGSNLSANRTWTIVTGDADRTLTLSGDATLNQNVSTTGTPTFVGVVADNGVTGAAPLVLKVNGTAVFTVHSTPTGVDPDNRFATLSGTMADIDAFQYGVYEEWYAADAQNKGRTGHSILLTGVPDVGSYHGTQTTRGLSVINQLNGPINIGIEASVDGGLGATDPYANTGLTNIGVRSRGKDAVELAVGGWFDNNLSTSPNHIGVVGSTYTGASNSRNAGYFGFFDVETGHDIDHLPVLATSVVLATNGDSGEDLYHGYNDDALVFGVGPTGAVLAPAIGPSFAQTHTLPAVASDTVALLAASQTLTNKTLTSPILVTPALGVATATSIGHATALPIVIGGTTTATWSIPSGASDTSNFLNISGSYPASPSAILNGVNFSFTPNASGSQQLRGMLLSLNAAYAGSSNTAGLRVFNGSSGAATGWVIGNNGNLGAHFLASSAGTTGMMVGSVSQASGSSDTNFGAKNGAVASTNSPARNIGTYSLAIGAGVNVPGFFWIHAGGSAPSIPASVALLADNGVSGADIFIARANGTPVLTIDGTGVLVYGTYSALGGETLAGYITIKDAAGNTRKVGVIA